MAEIPKGVNFQLAVDPDFLRDQYKSRIGFINGNRTGDIDPDEVTNLFGEIRAGSSKINGHRYLGNGCIEGLVEKEQSFLQNTEGLFGMDFNYHSYGEFAPSFLESLEMHKMKNPASVDGNRSLLTGAVTTATVSEFAAINRHVFPGSKLDIIDIAGISAEQACRGGVAQYTEGDALKMPFKDNTFDTVQSEHLLKSVSMFQPILSYRQAMEIYLQNAHRVLKPKGSIIMVEEMLPPEIAAGLFSKYKSFIPSRIMMQYVTEHTGELMDTIAESGFVDIEIKEALQFKTRRDLDTYIMLGNKWKFPEDAITESSDSILITASKPA